MTLTKKQLKAALRAIDEAKLFQYALGHPWRIKLQRGGQRHTFSTKETDRSKAAIEAEKIHNFLIGDAAKKEADANAEADAIAKAMKEANPNAEVKRPKVKTAMELTIEKFDPEPKKGDVVTFGKLIEKVEGVWSDGTARTFNDYCTSLRRVVSEIKGVARDKADGIRIADIAHADIEAWRTAYIKRKGGSSPAKKARARTSSNTILRGCKAMFGKKLLKKKLQLTDLPNPFAEIELSQKGLDYSFNNPGVDARNLLQKAVEELAATELEVFKAVVLALTLGLRRNEIDKLKYSSFNFEAGTVKIANSDDGTTKNGKSGIVDLEPELTQIILGWQAKATGTFVMESQVAAKPDSKYQHYRCQETLEKTTAWLRKAGVDSNEPLHFCRKLYGSLIKR